MAAVVAWVTRMVVAPVMNMGFVGMYELYEGTYVISKGSKGPG